MNEQEFERLWQAAEAENYAQQLRDEYPRWQARRRRNMGVAASLIVAVGIALPLLHRPQTEAPAQHESYVTAYCNRADMADKYWVDLASDLLMET